MLYHTCPIYYLDVQYFISTKFELCKFVAIENIRVFQLSSFFFYFGLDSWHLHLNVSECIALTAVRAPRAMYIVLEV